MITFGGNGLANLGNGIPFAYHGAEVLYRGALPMAFVTAVPPTPTPPPVGLPPALRRPRLRRKLRMRHRDREIEADTAGELADKLRALLAEDAAAGRVAAPAEAAREIHIDLSGLAPYLDDEDDEDDDEMAIIHAIAEVLDL